MKIIVDKLPQKPQQCLFSKRTYQGNYVCRLKGECIRCDVDKCRILRLAKENEHDGLG